jgi:hypothetical protein
MKKLRVKKSEDISKLSKDTFRPVYLYSRIKDAARELQPLQAISLEQWKNKDFSKEDVTKAAKAVQSEIDAFLSALRGRFK